MAWACLFLAQSSCPMGPPRRWRRFRAACALLVHQMLWHQPNEHSNKGDGSPDQLTDAALACEQCSAPTRAPEHVLSGRHRCACAAMAAASTEHRLQHGGCLHVVGRCSVGCIAWRSCCSEEINAHFRSSNCMCSAGVRGCMWGAVLGGRCEQAECFQMVHDAPAPSPMHLLTAPRT